MLCPFAVAKIYMYKNKNLAFYLFCVVYLFYFLRGMGKWNAHSLGADGDGDGGAVGGRREGIHPHEVLAWRLGLHDCTHHTKRKR